MRTLFKLNWVQVHIHKVPKKAPFKYKWQLPHRFLGSWDLWYFRAFGYVFKINLDKEYIF